MTEEAAYEIVEAQRWPDGPVCPHCSARNAGKLAGRSTRMGVYKCYTCRKPFTVKVGTIFESSHAPLATWLRAIAMVSLGYNAAEIGRQLGLTHKSAWKIARKISGAVGGR